MKVGITKILDHLFVVFGAFLFFQFPVFMHHYQQQLIGHVNELEWQVASMRQSASKSGKSLGQYIQKFIDHPDQDFSAQGATMKQVERRWNKLSTALYRLQHASILTHPFIFLFYLQSDIFKSTLKSFEPGLSLTLEGVLYALWGMLMGYCLFSACRLLGKRMLHITKKAMGANV